MVYCPNCANAIDVSIGEESCRYCGAYFGLGSSLKPTQQQPFVPVSHELPRLTVDEKIAKGIVGVPLFLVGMFLLLLTFRVGSFLVPVAILFLAVSAFIMISRNRVGKIISMIAGVLLLMFCWLVLRLIGG